MIKSVELVTKSGMLRELVKFYPVSERDYLYNDFYKLTNYTLELLLKEKKELKEEGCLKNEYCFF
jgi:hypothetical protein